ncbi:hypothetical protein [Devosia sp. Leaf64]|uniref:hypothetical protein n=1 Tax=Devosia sp. Leaf64 TaxID=1736229 RepID=UPI000714C7F4|nr:hypothetical protein [Devosia sp. Leaf64]KQN72407.1 hypothetical protein ASE94_07795 [Devosia sp. Leaf64]
MTIEEDRQHILNIRPSREKTFAELDALRDDPVKPQASTHKPVGSEEALPKLTEAELEFIRLAELAEAARNWIDDAKENKTRYNQNKREWQKTDRWRAEENEAYNLKRKEERQEAARLAGTTVRSYTKATSESRKLQNKLAQQERRKNLTEGQREEIRRKDRERKLRNK